MTVVGRQAWDPSFPILQGASGVPKASPRVGNSPSEYKKKTRSLPKPRPIGIPKRFDARQTQHQTSPRPAFASPSGCLSFLSSVSPEPSVALTDAIGSAETPNGVPLFVVVTEPSVIFRGPCAAMTVSLNEPGDAGPFSNTVIAAQDLGKMSLGSVTTTNNGTPFGVSADRVASVSATLGSGKTGLKKLDAPTDSQTQDDFNLRLI